MGQAKPGGPNQGTHMGPTLALSEPLSCRRRKRKPRRKEETVNSLKTTQRKSQTNGSLLHSPKSFIYIPTLAVWFRHETYPQLGIAKSENAPLVRVFYPGKEKSEWFL